MNEQDYDTKFYLLPWTAHIMEDGISPDEKKTRLIIGIEVHTRHFDTKILEMQLIESTTLEQDTLFEWYVVQTYMQWLKELQ